MGDETITDAALVHWMSILQGGAAITDPAGAKNLALRRHALEFLISSRWLIGEAASQGIAISKPEIHGQVSRAENVAYTGGEAELRELLKSTGRTLADVERQAIAELAAVKLRQKVIESAGTVTRAQVAAYYAAHKRSFLIPELRRARFDNWKHWTAAEKYKREVEAGKSLTAPAQLKVNEVFTTARVPPGDVYEEAIDRSEPYVVSGPYKIHRDYWLYQVVKIIPAHQQTLAEVGAMIRKRLTAERQERALASFAREWSASWTARTSCSAGQIVQKCRQYHGPESAAEFTLELE